VASKEDYTDKALEMFSSVGEYFFISLLLGLSVTLLVESWRKNLTYLIAAVVFGTLLGYGIMNVEQWSSFAVLATIVGTVTGPATVAAFQKKSLLDVAEDLKDTATGVMNRRSHSGYPRYPSSTPSRRTSDPRRLPTQGDPYD